jgi:hypothetical protein
MVYEQRASLIVMLTDFEEKRRVKAVKYWPDFAGADRCVTGLLGHMNV